MASSASRLLTNTILLALSFTMTGAATVLLGPLIPHLSSSFGLTDAQAGRLFLSQFLASTAGALLLGRIGARWRMERTLAFAYLAAGAGVIAVGFAAREAAALCVAAYGFALGLINPAANRVAGPNLAALNLLNMHWSVGAVLAPPLVAWLLARSGLGLVLPALGTLLLLCGVATLRLHPATGATASPPVPKSLAHPAAWSTALFLFLYVGAETSLSGWLPSFSARLAGLPPEHVGLPQAAFWASIVGGRLLVGVRPGAATPERWIARGLLLALTGIVVLLLARRLDVLLAGIVLAGAGMAPLFPSAVAIFQQRAGPSASALIGNVFAAGGFGGAVFPWLVGVISSAIGSLAAGLLAAAAAIAALTLLSASSRR